MKIEFTDQEKHRIVDLAEQHYNDSGFNKSEFARSMGLISTDITNLFGRKWVGNSSLIGQTKWITIARHVGYSRIDGRDWKTAETEVYTYIFKQLSLLQEESLTGILVDDAGIGKTYACKEYCKKNRTAFYIDCSVNYRKTQFIKALGRAVGVGDTGRLDDVLQNALFALKNMEKPALVLDEAGDCKNDTYLVIKTLINDLDGDCAVYMVGSDGLKAKIERGIANKQLGYTEVFSRFGKGFRKALPVLMQDKEEVLAKMATQIAEVNGLTKEQAKEVVNGLKVIKGYGDMRIAKRKILGVKKLAKI
jgi:hypothetical protein